MHLCNPRPLIYGSDLNVAQPFLMISASAQRLDERDGARIDGRIPSSEKGLIIIAITKATSGSCGMEETLLGLRDVYFNGEK